MVNATFQVICSQSKQTKQHSHAVQAEIVQMNNRDQALTLTLILRLQWTSNFGHIKNNGMRQAMGFQAMEFSLFCVAVKGQYHSHWNLAYNIYMIHAHTSARIVDYMVNDRANRDI